MNETELESDGYYSPLKILAVESHELYLELLDAGFPEGVASQILAHMLSDMLMAKLEYDELDDDEDDEDSPEDVEPH